MEDGINGLLSSIKRKSSKMAKYILQRLSNPARIEVGHHTAEIPIKSYSTYKEVSFYKRNELEGVSDLLSELDSNDIFLDVGANLGIHSIFASKVAKEAYAIEPHPTNIAHMCLNRRQNNVGFKIFSCAFSSEQGYAKLPAPISESSVDGSASINGDVSCKDHLYVKSEVGDLLFATQNLEVPSIVKIDVEGAEKDVIEGLSDTLNHEQCRIIYCEIHEKLGVQYEEIVNILRSYGFVVEAIENVSYGRTVKVVK